MTSEQYQQWMQSWRRAAIALEEVKREELARMTEAEALRATDRVLALVGTTYHDPRRMTSSGLVEQQRLFQMLRRV
jgi:hypothetical protein